MRIKGYKSLDVLTERLIEVPFDEEVTLEVTKEELKKFNDDMGDILTDTMDTSSKGTSIISYNFGGIILNIVKV